MSQEQKKEPIVVATIQWLSNGECRVFMERSYIKEQNLFLLPRLFEDAKNLFIKMFNAEKELNGKTNRQ